MATGIQHMAFKTACNNEYAYCKPVINHDPVAETIEFVVEGTRLRTCAVCTCHDILASLHPKYRQFFACQDIFAQPLTSLVSPMEFCCFFSFSSFFEPSRLSGVFSSLRTEFSPETTSMTVRVAAWLAAEEEDVDGGGMVVLVSARALAGCCTAIAAARLMDNRNFAVSSLILRSVCARGFLLVPRCCLALEQLGNVCFKFAREWQARRCAGGLDTRRCSACIFCIVAHAHVSS